MKLIDAREACELGRWSRRTLATLGSTGKLAVYRRTGDLHNYYDPREVAALAKAVRVS